MQLSPCPLSHPRLTNQLSLFTESQPMDARLLYPQLTSPGWSAACFMCAYVPARLLLNYSWVQCWSLTCEYCSASVESHSPVNGLMLMCKYFFLFLVPLLWISMLPVPSIQHVSINCCGRIMLNTFPCKETCVSLNVQDFGSSCNEAVFMFKSRCFTCSKMWKGAPTLENISMQRADPRHSLMFICVCVRVCACACACVCFTMRFFIHCSCL